MVSQHIINVLVSNFLYIILINRTKCKRVKMVSEFFEAGECVKRNTLEY